MTQAQASLARIQTGAYTPDSAARGFQFEDGSSLVLVDGVTWRAIGVAITEETTCRCGYYGGSTGSEKNLHTHCEVCANSTDANGVCRRAGADGRCPDAYPCCGAPTWGAHRDNVAAGNCSRYALNEAAARVNNAVLYGTPESVAKAEAELHALLAEGSR